jgi:hypothetical protein
MTVMKVCYSTHARITVIIHNLVLMKETTFHRLAMLFSSYKSMTCIVLGPLYGSLGQEWGLAPSNGLSRTCFILLSGDSNRAGFQNVSCLFFPE